MTKPSKYAKRKSCDSMEISSFTLREHDDHILNQLCHVPQPDRELSIITMSHAESMGTVFPQWTRLCYRRGPVTYEPYDMNMPSTLIPRKQIHYQFDPPLTERGQIVALTYGRGLATAGIAPYEIYCSPDMKSIQTAHFIIKGLESSYTSINIDASLMSYRQLYPHNMQEMLLSPRVFSGLGYPINLEYEACEATIVSRESIDEYCSRVRRFYTQRIARIEQRHVVIVGDNCLVELAQNGRIETVDEVIAANRKASCQMNHMKLKPNELKLVHCPITPFSRCLYDVKPHLWSESSGKLSLPNHPDADSMNMGG